MAIIYYILPLLAAYLIGSIPFGLLLTKFFGKGDIRTIGSGNIGATNVLRTGSKKLALATLILDASKGAVCIALYIQYQAQMAPADQEPYTTIYYMLILGLLTMIGHCYPVWLKFKGGKGVATTLGVLLAAVPFTGLIACATWLVSAKFGKISSVAAMSAMIVAPVMTYVFYGMYPAIINALISALVIWRHRENIARIRAGTEPRIGDKKKDS